MKNSEERLSKRTKIYSSIVSWAFALIAFGIPIEYKYDKPFRYFSLTLIPEGLQLPGWFDKKIHFYPSDITAILLLVIALFCLAIPLRRLLTEKGTPFLLSILLFAALSIYYSPLANYSIAYLRLWQVGTAVLLFAIFTSLEKELRDKTAKRILYALIIAGSFQSAIAIAQYCTQKPLGLRCFGEPKFEATQAHPHIVIPGGVLWRFSPLPETLNRIAVVRTPGTLPHPNALGGFLCMTLLLTIGQISTTEGRKKGALIALFLLQLLGLNFCFSRAAVLAFFLGTVVWTFLSYKQLPRKAFIQIGSVLLGATLLIGFLFTEHLISRSPLAPKSPRISSNDVRFFYQDIAFKMIEEKPFSGVGYAQFTLESPKFLPPGENPNYHLSGVHNIYLMLAAETGLFSLAAFLIFIFTLLWKALRAPRTALLSTLTSIFVAFLFIGGCDFYLILFHQGRLMFFLIAALLASQLVWKPKEAPHENRLADV